MPIENRNLKPGTHLVGRYHKQSHSCEVVEGEGGKLRYRLEDGREFKSPSAAGMAITGHACDGWAFWGVEAATAPQPTENSPMESQQAAQTTENTLGQGGQDEAPIPTTTLAPAVEQSNAAKKSFFRTPNQKGVPKGKTRWYCQECGKSFLSATSQMPQACPQGHRAG
jgi:hypothetical protein